AGDAPRQIFLGENMKRLVATRKLLEVETRTEEFWSEIRRDLTVELEEAGVKFLNVGMEQLNYMRLEEGCI
ncbi:unnamed protein product, partial [Effrenium voratum]